MGSLLIRDGAVLTAEGWLEPGYVYIEGEKITRVGAGKPDDLLVDQADEVIDARRRAVMPGLTNAHTHLSQTFMRGLAGGRPLIEWLKEVVWPIQGVITPEELHLAARLGLVENLRGGVTEVVNHHKIVKSPQHTDAVMQAGREIGLRFMLARSWADIGEITEKPDAIMADLERLFVAWGSQGRVRVANGPIALWRCSAETLQSSHKLAVENGSFTHFHISESQREEEMSLEMYGKRQIEWLASIDVLDADTQIVHGVWLQADEIGTVASAGAAIIHCPVSNAVLGSGIAPVAQFLEHDISVKLGTDGSASNDVQDVWETLKSAVCLARASTLDATVVPPKQALQLATGGRTLEADNPADLILVNLDRASAVPVNDIDSALVLGTNGADVETVIVAGEVLMRERKVLVLDEQALLDECRSSAERLLRRAGISS